MNSSIAMKNKSITQPLTTCIAITEKAIKITQGCGQKISQLKAAAINDKTDEEITRGFDILLKEKKLKPKSPGRIILSIPRQACATGYARLPSTRPDEIKEMARLQAGKLLPYEPQTIVFSYRTLRITAEGYADIILLIVHQDIVKRYLRLLEKYEFRPQEITIDAEGMPGWLALGKDVSPEEPVMLVDLDSGCGRLDIIAGGSLLYSRAFGLLAPPVEYKLRLLDEINKSLIAYDKEDVGQKPAHGFITGADESLKLIDEDFMKNFNFKCISCPQTQNMPLKADSAVSISDLKENSFASLLGMVLSAKRPSFNLLPEEIIIRREKDAYQRQVYISIGLFFLIAATLAAAMGMDVLSKRSLKQRLSRQLQNLSSAALGIERMDKKLSLLKNHLEQSSSCLDILTEVFRIAADDVRLILLEYDASGPLLLRGQARTIAVVFNFVNGLEASGRFKGIQVRYASKRKVKNEELADFEIVCPLEGK